MRGRIRKEEDFEVFDEHLVISDWPEIVLGYVLSTIHPQNSSLLDRLLLFSFPRIGNNRPTVKEETILLTELIC